MGAIQMLVYVNQEKFIPGKYGEEAISRYSQIYFQQVDEAKPNWIDSEILISELEDETNVVNLGLGDNEQNFYFWQKLGTPQPSAWIADLN